MLKEVFVRLVPKSRQARSRMSSFDSVLSPDAAKSYSPDAKNAQKAQVELANQNVTAQTTPENRIELSLAPEKFKELFGVDVAPAPSQPLNKSATVTNRTKHESFLHPQQEVEVPQILKDTIDFAYVPRPVEYHDVTFLPPNEDGFHLSLESVAQALNASRCHRRGWTGQDVKVAMTDSGFARHPYFDRGGYNMVRLGGPGADNPERDRSGHGTGESANIVAIAPNVTMICVKQGSSAAGDLETAIAQNPTIITNSWGWDIDRVTKAQLKLQDPNMFNELVDVETVIADAVSRGIIVCFSAGNGHFAFPACLPQVFAIGGVMVQQDSGLKASDYASSFTSTLYSTRQVPDFCGVVGSATRAADGTLPGHIMLPVPAGSSFDGDNFAPPKSDIGWGIFSGTSAASPQAAGVLALMKGINPRLTADEARQILRSTAVDVLVGVSAMGQSAGPGRDAATGAGLIDAFAACEAAAAMI